MKTKKKKKNTQKQEKQRAERNKVCVEIPTKGENNWNRKQSKKKIREAEEASQRIDSIFCTS